MSCHFLQLHQSTELRIKQLRVVLTHRDHKPGLVSKMRLKTIWLLQCLRRAKARRVVESGREDLHLFADRVAVSKDCIFFPC